MHPLLRKLLGMNWLLFGLMLALMGYGIYAIYSATWFREATFWRSQLLWMLVCLPGFFAFSFIDYRWIRWGALPIYLVSVGLLLATRIIGVERYGAKSWLDLGPLNFQPSQTAIVGGILVLALFLSQFRNLPAILRIIGCAIIAGAPCLLILVQPDLGSVLVWGPVILAMFFIAGIPKRYLIVMLLCVIIAIPVAVNFVLKPYQRDRIIAFLDHDVDPLGVSWTINQSLIAIGSGGTAGKGFKAPNTQNELGFLPSTIVHNDFIFSVMGEQHGFIGAVILITVFAFLLLAGLQIAMSAEDDLGRLVAVGIVAMLFAHIFMNIGMTIS
ncbi:MAG TPA: FtsW/RodA/SpoVE family cell cycle protein, partial [Chthoniobacterales bacterium]